VLCSLVTVWVDMLLIFPEPHVCWLGCAGVVAVYAVGTSYRREQVRFAGHTTESTEGWAVQQGAHDFRDERERGQHFCARPHSDDPWHQFPAARRGHHKRFAALFLLIWRLFMADRVRLSCAALERVFDMYQTANVADVIPKILSQYPASDYADGWVSAGVL
jgi:hypothetical protein